MFPLIKCNQVEVEVFVFLGLIELYWIAVIVIACYYKYVSMSIMSYNIMYHVNQFLVFQMYMRYAYNFMVSWWEWLYNELTISRTFLYTESFAFHWHKKNMNKMYTTVRMQFWPHWWGLNTQITLKFYIPLIRALQVRHCNH